MGEFIYLKVYFNKVDFIKCPKARFFYWSSKTDKPLETQSREKERIQISNSRNEKETITTDKTGILNKIKIFEQLNGKKDKLLEKPNLKKFKKR